ncbi:MAG: hypothetical protein JW966_01230 [Anaerolineae bacterium]|nr:hypothetical protein [Anaerolineae bacterium]
MRGSRIDYQMSAERTFITYRLPFRIITPVVWLWAALGGVSLGVGAAMALLVAGLTTVTDDGRIDLRLALVVVSVVSTLLLYWLVYVRVARTRVLRVTFHYEWSELSVRLPDADHHPIRLAFDNVIEFRLAEQAVGRRTGCVLLLETDHDEPLTLVALPVPCHDNRHELPQLAGRLNARLQRVHGDTSPGIPPMEIGGPLPPTYQPLRPYVPD